MVDVPRVRANLIMTAMEAIDSLDPDEARRVRELLPRQTLREIESATRMDWLPFEFDIQILEATLHVLGPERFRELRHRTTINSAHSPFLSSVLAGALHLFGASPLAAFRLVPRVYTMITKDAGIVRAEDIDAKRLRLAYENVPAVMMASSAWRTTVALDTEAVFELVRARGTVVVDAWEPERGRLALLVTLTP
jgi:hypothetical protein